MASIGAAANVLVCFRMVFGIGSLREGVHCLGMHLLLQGG